jgi:D-sedoheptulose 7-phosphate isomerase
MSDTYNFQAYVDQHISVMNSLSSQSELIQEMTLKIRKYIATGGTIFTMGNGGSASDAQHFTGELIGRFKQNRRALKSVCLNTDTSVLTCIANDYGYDEIYSRQIEALASDKDLVVLFSTSGNSKNIVRAAQTCIAKNINCILFTGKTGGELAKLCSNILSVNTDVTARIQEAHIFLIHFICESLEDLK